MTTAPPAQEAPAVPPARAPTRKERILARLPGRLREIPADLATPILGAIGFVFALNLVLGFLATGRLSPLAVLANLAGSFLTFLVAFLVGRALGKSFWPVAGARLSRRLLATYAKRPEHGDLVMTGRPEFRATRAKRVFETSALVAAILVLYVEVARTFVPLSGTALFFVPALVATLLLTVALVPHWAFAALGFRRLDRARFIVKPLTRDYSDRLRLSNGALVVLVIAISGVVLRQAGATDVQVFIEILQLILSIIPATVVLAASAVAFYARREPRVLEQMARDAISVGFYDARGENETEILAHLRRRPTQDAR